MRRSLIAARARRVRNTKPRPARPIASSGSDAGSGADCTDPICSVKLSALAPVSQVQK
jgi:hypothetical protein